MCNGRAAEIKISLHRISLWNEALTLCKIGKQPRTFSMTLLVFLWIRFRIETAMVALQKTHSNFWFLLKSDSRNAEGEIKTWAFFRQIRNYANSVRNIRVNMQGCSLVYCCFINVILCALPSAQHDCSFLEIEWNLGAKSPRTSVPEWWMVLPRAEALPSSVTVPLWLLSAVTHNCSGKLSARAEYTDNFFSVCRINGGPDFFFWFIHYAEL